MVVPSLGLIESWKGKKKDIDKTFMVSSCLLWLSSLEDFNEREVGFDVFPGKKYKKEVGFDEIQEHDRAIRQK